MNVNHRGITVRAYLMGTLILLWSTFFCLLALLGHTRLFVRREDAAVACAVALQERESQLAHQEFLGRQFQLAEEEWATAERRKWTRKWFRWQR